MDPRYAIVEAGQIITPALVVFRDIVMQNMQEIVRIAKSPLRLRPHVKTHKMREIVEMQVSMGITKHKCSTFAEAEMLANAGIKDVCLAYNLVGPNISRAAKFVERFADVALSITADHRQPIADLGLAMAATGCTIDVLLDIDTGQHRTGVPIGSAAADLYGQIVSTRGLNAGGLHVYDGQNHQTDLAERTSAVDAVWQTVTNFRNELVNCGWPVPRIVAGGTGSFSIYAEKDEKILELSPGTCVFSDVGYSEMFPDLDFTPAALVLTRVISKPISNRVTFDLGYKAVASDSPAGTRLTFPDIPDAKQVLQNEEHLVIETIDSERFQPGQEQLAIPRHVCPTTALHKEAFVISDGKVAGRWEVAARDRWLTI